VNKVSGLCKTVIVGGALLFCLADAAVSQQETAEQFVERIKKAIANDEWGRASSGVKHALAISPRLPSALFVAAQVYWYEGARSSAIESLDKAVETQPFFPEAHFLLAQCFKDTGKLEKAREQLDIAISQGTPLFAAYRLLAEIEIAKEDFDAAINALETGVHFSTEADPELAARPREQIDQLRELVDKLKKFAVLQADQKAPDIVQPRVASRFPIGRSWLSSSTSGNHRSYKKLFPELLAYASALH